MGRGLRWLRHRLLLGDSLLATSAPGGFAAVHHICRYCGSVAFLGGLFRGSSTLVLHFLSVEEVWKKVRGGGGG